MPSLCGGDHPGQFEDIDRTVHRRNTHALTSYALASQETEVRTSVRHTPAGDMTVSQQGTGRARARKEGFAKRVLEASAIGSVVVSHYCAVEAQWLGSAVDAGRGRPRHADRLLHLVSIHAENVAHTAE